MGKKIKGPAVYDIYAERENIQPLIDYLETLPRHNPIIPPNGYRKYRYNNYDEWERREPFVRVKIRQEELTMVRLKIDVKKIVVPLY